MNDAEAAVEAPEAEETPEDPKATTERHETLHAEHRGRLDDYGSRLEAIEKALGLRREERRKAEREQERRERHEAPRGRKRH